MLAVQGTLYSEGGAVNIEEEVARALLAEIAPTEWEYRYAEVHEGGSMYTYGPEHDERGAFGSFEEASGARIEDSDIVVRRRKAGEWEPVEGSAKLPQNPTEGSTT